MAREGNPTTPFPVAMNRVASDRLPKRSYTTPEPIRLTGMTRWAKIGPFPPALHDPTADTGKPALFYTTAQTVKALIVREMRRAGFTLRQVQQVTRNLKEHGLRLAESEAYRFTDGYSVSYALSNDEVGDISKHRRQMLLLLPIHEQQAKQREVA